MVRLILASAFGFAVAAFSVATPRPAASQVGAAGRPPVPAYAHGSTDNMTVFLDFGDRLAGGGEPLSDAEVYTIFYRVAEKLVPSIGATVTTVPPDSPPGAYVTVRFLGSGGPPWRPGTAGNCPTKMVRNTSLYVPNVVYVGLMGADRAGAVASHEAVHCLQPDGLSHEETPVGNLPNLMAPGAPMDGVLSPGMRLAVLKNIADLQGGWRLGPFVPLQGGQWTFDWHRIN